jgi:hypothetical protein
MDKGSYSSSDVQVLTDIAQIKRDIHNINIGIKDIKTMYDSQWTKIDGHSKAIIKLDTKATIMGSIGGIVMAFLLSLFSKIFGN